MSNIVKVGDVGFGLLYQHFKIAGGFKVPKDIACIADFCSTEVCFGILLTLQSVPRVWGYCPGGAWQTGLRYGLLAAASP